MTDDQQRFEVFEYDPADPREFDLDPNTVAKRLPSHLRPEPPAPMPEHLKRKARRQRGRILASKRYRLVCAWPFEGDDQECEGPVHVHHLWPTAIFGAELAEAMPKQPLCQKHHDEYHDAVQVYWWNYFTGLEDRIHGRT